MLLRLCWLSDPGTVKAYVRFFFVFAFLFQNFSNYGGLNFSYIFLNLNNLHQSTLSRYSTLPPGEGRNSRGKVKKMCSFSVVGTRLCGSPDKATLGELNSLFGIMKRHQIAFHHL